MDILHRLLEWLLLILLNSLKRKFKNQLSLFFNLKIIFLFIKNKNNNNRLVTASLDNSVRVWDPKDLTSLGILELSETDPEITCLLYLSFSNLFVTGHENG